MNFLLLIPFVPKLTFGIKDLFIFPCQGWDWFLAYKFILNLELFSSICPLTKPSGLVFLSSSSVTHAIFEFVHIDIWAFITLQTTIEPNSSDNCGWLCNWCQSVIKNFYLMDWLKHNSIHQLHMLERQCIWFLHLFNVLSTFHSKLNCTTEFICISSSIEWSSRKETQTYSKCD